MTPDTMTRDERSLLLYLETCAVDQGGLAEGRRMNKEDHEAAKKFAELKLAYLYRVPATILFDDNLEQVLRKYTHWVTLTPAGFELAHRLRVRRAGTLGPHAQAIRRALVEKGKIEVEAE